MIHQGKSPAFVDCFFVFLAVFFIQFKSIFSSVSLGFFSEVFIVLAVSVGLLNLLGGVKLRRSSIILYLYIAYLFSILLLSGFISNEASYLAGMVGFLSLAGMIIFWMGFVSRVDYLFVFKVFLIFGCFNAVGAFVNYFISPTIFGLIHHSVYTDAEVFSRDNVTRRAVSFIVSPQSLSLFLSVCFVLVGSVVNRAILASGLRLLLLGAIILTASKAAFVFLIIFYVLNYFERPQVWIGALLCGCSILIIFGDKLERIFYVVEYMKDISTYSAFPIWESAMGLSDEVLNDIFGLGLGVISRGAQEINDYVLGFGSTESFILQLIVEVGYVGLFFFLVVYVCALVFVFKRDRRVFSILAALLAVSLFTPAVYGFTSAIYFYYFIVFAICGTTISFPQSSRRL